MDIVRQTQDVTAKCFMDTASRAQDIMVNGQIFRGYCTPRARRNSQRLHEFFKASARCNGFKELPGSGYGHARMRSSAVRTASQAQEDVMISSLVYIAGREQDEAAKYFMDIAVEINI